MSVKAVELMLPAIFMDKQMQPMLLAAFFCLLVAAILALMAW